MKTTQIRAIRGCIAAVAVIPATAVTAAAAPSQQAYLKASNTGFNDRFGTAVAVDGETIVVGAPLEDSNAVGVDNNFMEDSGAAYVFVREAGQWKFQAILKASNPDAFDYFGSSVSVCADTIVIGAPGEDSIDNGVNGNQANNDAPESGAAYVFVRNNGAWTQQAYIKASNTDAADDFGRAVAVRDNGDTIIAGAPAEDSDATGVNGIQTNNAAADSGAAYLFRRSGSNWSQQAYLKASNTEAADAFGWSVALRDGGRVAVGAVGEDSNARNVGGNQSDNTATDSGAVYVFQYRTVAEITDWRQEAYLKASNTDPFDAFGHSVSIQGDILVAGAPYEDSNATNVNGDRFNNDAQQAGAAYAFVRSNAVWSPGAYLKASNSDAFDQFGWSVSTDLGVIAVGADREDSRSSGLNGDEENNDFEDSGAAYVYVPDSGSWIQQSYVKASNSNAFDWFGASVSLTEGILVAGAAGEDSSAVKVGGSQSSNSASYAGAAYAFDLGELFPKPEISVEQPGGSPLVDASGTVNFGSRVLGSDTALSFTVRNMGTSTLTGLDVTKAGAHSDDFLISGPSLGSLAPGASASFTVTFKPSATGPRTADLQILSDDDDENPFDIGLSGTGSAPALPEIVVQQPRGSNLKDGVAKRGFGTVKVGKQGATKSFTIRNTGSARLTGLAISKTGAHARDFIITGPAKRSLAPGGSTTFKVIFAPRAKGARNATIRIKNNDPDENPFDIKIVGSGAAR